MGQRDYKVGQILRLQSGARWDYKVEQDGITKVGQLFGLQSGTGITKWGRDYKSGIVLGPLGN